MDPCHGAAIIKIRQQKDGKVERKRDMSCHTEDTSKTQKLTQVQR